MKARGSSDRKSDAPKSELAAALTRVVARLSDDVDGLAFGEPVAHTYNPLAYARGAIESYFQRHARPRPQVLLVGMNPGPYGMVQTGVPFGEVAAVRDWLGIDSGVVAPPVQFAARPVDGFACTRSEVSGRRVWSWAAQRFGTPAAFFESFFIWNYCPLAFLEEGGRNRTPDKLPLAEREPLFALCDRALAEFVELIEPQHVVGIGAFSFGRVQAALPRGSGPKVGTILHPSPASPIANRGWAEQAERQLVAMGVELPPG